MDALKIALLLFAAVIILAAVFLLFRAMQPQAPVNPPPSITGTQIEFGGCRFIGPSSYSQERISEIPGMSGNATLIRLNATGSSVVAGVTSDGRQKVPESQLGNYVFGMKMGLGSFDSENGSTIGGMRAAQWHSFGTGGKEVLTAVVLPTDGYMRMLMVTYLPQDAPEGRIVFTMIRDSLNCSG